MLSVDLGPHLDFRLDATLRWPPTNLQGRNPIRARSTRAACGNI